MVSLTKLATRHASPDPPVAAAGAVGGANVAGASLVGVGLAADSGVNVGCGVGVTCACCVSFAATVMATAVAIESLSEEPPQEVRTSVKSMRMDRKTYLLFLFIRIPFSNLKKLPENYTAVRLKVVNEKRPKVSGR